MWIDLNGLPSTSTVRETDQILLQLRRERFNEARIRQWLAEGAGEITIKGSVPKKCVHSPLGARSRVLAQRLGRATAGVGLVIDAHRIGTAEDTVGETVRVVGGWGGAAAGAWSFGTIMAPLGPIGIGAGGLFGSIVGSIAGEGAFGSLYDSVWNSEDE